MFFHLFSLSKNTKGSRSRRRRRKVNLLMSLIKPTASHSVKESHFCGILKDLIFKSNQIKSNHFYCHITTAQVPWWVKFLWACSRQCRKTTDNLHMDRQCKKTTNNLHMDRQCKKTTAIYIWTVHIYRLYRRQCAKYTYIYSVYTYIYSKYTYIYSDFVGLIINVTFFASMASKATF